MLPTTKLELAVAVYRLLDAPVFEHGRIKGCLLPDVFEEASHALEEHLLLQSSTVATGEVLFIPPLDQNSFFAFSVDDLLQSSQRRQAIPAKFYLADINFLYDGDYANAPQMVRSYIDAVTLVQLLSPLADHVIKKGIPKLIFFHGEKFELFLEYAKQDLEGLKGIDIFAKEFISTLAHIDQKKTIVKSILLEMKKEAGAEDFNVGFVMLRFEEYARRVSSSYQLYVSEFSFQKIKAEVEKSKFEALAKINKVFSEIQNQLLAVPVALIIACGQMEAASGFSLKNFFVMAGSLVFALFMFFLILNQRNTLRSIFLEMTAEWDLIKGNHKAVKIKFDEPYKLLRKRYRYQSILLEVVGLVVLISFSITVAMFFYFSDVNVVPWVTIIWLSLLIINYVLLRGLSIFSDISLREDCDDKPNV
jgi:hypothetical protein